MILDAIQGWRHEDREELAAKHAENAARMEAFDRELKAMSAAVKLGYPEGDADAHRRYHEALIKKAEARARLYEKLLAELIGKGFIAFLIFLAGAIGYYLKEKFLK